MNLDYSKKSDEIITWLKQIVKNAGFTNVVLALSGGIDSALSAVLSVKALGKDHVRVLLLPYGNLSKKATEDAKKVVKFLELPRENVHTIDVQDSVDSLWGPVARQPHIHPQGDPEYGAPRSRATPTEEFSNVRVGNIMARARMIYLYDFAKANNCLVVGTENKSEYYLGYFTRFGDEASDVEPIRGLYKTQVKEMAKYLDLPKEIITKAPTAGLWEGQSDEKEFGFSYADADQILYHYFDEGLGEEGMSSLEIPKETIEKVLNFVKKNEFKHKLPYIQKG